MSSLFSINRIPYFAPPLRIAILISGRGSNMEAIIRHARQSKKRIEVVLVISDRPGVPGLDIARSYGIPARYMDPGGFKTKLHGESELLYIQCLRRHQVDLVCLAGFMRVVKTAFLKAFHGRVLNIHPSLLPAYPGLNVHERVLAHKESRTGCTVHVVNDGIDRGRILAQKSLRIHPKETFATLSERVLALEHELYWKVIMRIYMSEDPLFRLPFVA